MALQSMFREHRIADPPIVTLHLTNTRLKISSLGLLFDRSAMVNSHPMDEFKKMCCGPLESRKSCEQTYFLCGEVVDWIFSGEFDP